MTIVDNTSTGEAHLVNAKFSRDVMPCTRSKFPVVEGRLAACLSLWHSIFGTEEVDVTKGVGVDTLVANGLLLEGKSKARASPSGKAGPVLLCLGLSGAVAAAWVSRRPHRKRCTGREEGPSGKIGSDRLVDLI